MESSKSGANTEPAGITRPAPDETSISEHFPRQFDFFGLGRVELISRHKVELSECVKSPFVVAFQVIGDEQGLCSICFDLCPQNDDETSMWLELANVLASKLITQLADARCADITISPPQPLNDGDQKLRLLRAAFGAGGAPGVWVKKYQFSTVAAPAGARSVTMRLAYQPATRGGRS